MNCVELGFLTCDISVDRYLIKSDCIRRIATCFPLFLYFSFYLYKFVLQNRTWFGEKKHPTVLQKKREKKLTTGGAGWVLCRSMFVAMVTGWFVFVDDVRDLATRGRTVRRWTGSGGGRHIEYFRVRFDEVVFVISANFSKLQIHKIKEKSLQFVFSKRLNCHNKIWERQKHH